MDAKRRHVVELIRVAFKGVRLGNGVGLWQGQAIDDYMYEKEQAECRERDEKINWEAIPIDDLNQCSSCLSYLDPEGMRFILPAFLVSDLKGTLDQEISFYLIGLDDFTRDHFNLFTDTQRAAVAAFLEILSDDPHYDSQRDGIEESVTQFWRAAE